MASTPVTVLGGGNTAFSVAARLSLKGFEVTLFEHPDHADSVAELARTNTIALDGVLETGPAHIRKITIDPREALDASDLLLLIVPAYAHKAFAEICAPYLRPEHIVVVMPGTLGTLEWARIGAEFNSGSFTLAEVDTAPYVCRKTSPSSAVIWGEVTGLGLGVLPSSRTEEVRNALDPLFPGITAYDDVMACGLSAMNPVVHPAGVLMNAGRVEYSRGEFYFYEEGVTRSVAKVIMQVDEERREVGRALGYDLSPVNKGFHDAGFGPCGDLWSTINGSYMLTRLKAPGSLESRWLTEDIPYGLAAWSRVGTQFGVETPIMDAFVTVGSIVMGFDAWKEGRGPRELGISGMGIQELKRFLETGIISD